VARAGYGNVRYVRVAAVRAADGGVADGGRAAELLGAGGQVQGMQLDHIMVNAVHRVLGLGRGVERVGAGIDEHRVGDADLRSDVSGAGDAVGNNVDPLGRIDK